MGESYNTIIDLLREMKEAINQNTSRQKRQDEKTAKLQEKVRGLKKVLAEMQTQDVFPAPRLGTSRAPASGPPFLAEFSDDGLITDVDEEEPWQVCAPRKGKRSRGRRGRRTPSPQNIGMKSRSNGVAVEKTRKKNAGDTFPKNERQTAVRTNEPTDKHTRRYRSSNETEVGRQNKKLSTDSWPALPSHPKTVSPREAVRNAPAASPQKKTRVPPIILRDCSKWTMISDTCTKSTPRINFKRAKMCSAGIRIHLSSPDDFRALVEFFDAQAIQYHTFTPAEEKTLRVIIRGVSVEVDPSKIRRGLEDQGFDLIKITRPSTRRAKIPLQLLFAELPADQTDIYDVTSVCGLPISVESPRKSLTISQCHRCQRFGHVQRNCRALPKCVKCAEGHLSEQCTVPRTSPPKCANCGEGHTANYPGCIRFPPRSQAPSRVPLEGNIPTDDGKNLPAKSSASTAAENQPVRGKTLPESHTQEAALESLITDFDDWSDRLIDSVVSARSTDEMKERLVEALVLLFK